MKPLKPHPLFPTLAATLGHGRKLLHAWAGIVDCRMREHATLIVIFLALTVIFAISVSFMAGVLTAP